MCDICERKWADSDEQVAFPRVEGSGWIVYV